MISLLNGTVRSIHSDRLVVEVGGFGMSVLVTPATTTQVSLGAQVQLFTSLVVRGLWSERLQEPQLAMSNRVELAGILRAHQSEFQSYLALASDLQVAMHNRVHEIH